MHRHVPQHLRTGTKYLKKHKQRRVASLSMMPFAQFGGQGRAVGSVLGLLAGLCGCGEGSNLVKSQFQIDAMYEAWRQAATWMSTGVPWVLVVILVAFMILLGIAVEREGFARSPCGDTE